ncbi:calmodulin-binding receptor-like cytoplasmic kinase 2 [Prosopis cineraria]|uniref:calmodulin-binding receptor-like cytoplasmic kinase 2 n=1 Tax=Prosopis cineraria TaxID=364024 RepID=UPI00240EB218|nr:calmodulin-binding receptor-like cytoplasmic kinase 2 [Prosopis cineraria]
MKNTPERHFVLSSQSNQNGGSDTNKHNQKSRPSLKSFKSLAKKFALVFAIFRSGKGKPSAEVAGSSDVKRNRSKSRWVSSFSTDVSSESNKNSWKFSHSYASSSVTSGQLGMGNFSFEELYNATRKFSADNIIGEGGFGTVYKGKLSDGSIVAIKRSKKTTHDKNLAEFKNEINTLSKIEHLNLVRLYGYLEHENEKMVVVEYVGNGTLREHLNGTRGNGLEIGDRLDIAIDVAHAITYLHMYTDHPIIHRDIKSSNILLTEKLRAKVADFGFARLASDDPAATHISTQIKGTAGYLDPEYLRTYQLTKKSDVYSFGVLLVEMMTGRHPLEPKRPLSERVTIRWAMQMLKQGDAVIAMDPRLWRSPASTTAMEKVMKLAFQCLAPLRQSRPSMKTCAEILWGIRKELRDQALANVPPLASHHSADFTKADDRKNKFVSLEVEDDDNYKFVSA